VLKNKIAFITGTSSGIGKAIAEKLLEQGDFFVVGFSRRNNISHENYEHITADLMRDIDFVRQINFGAYEGYDQHVLINNAARVQPVQHLGSANVDEVIKSIYLNFVAPVILTGSFIKAFSDSPGKIIINISTGAAKNPIEGMNIYCSTKAGLDMLSKVVQLELQREGTDCRIFAVAPGIVDTEMQDQIRESDEKHFGRKQDFVRYKKEGELANPNIVANKYIDIINNPNKYPDVVFSIPK
jgi:benzil reductase ((S)-benzoin forming)